VGWKVKTAGGERGGKSRQAQRRRVMREKFLEAKKGG